MNTYFVGLRALALPRLNASGAKQLLLLRFVFPTEPSSICPFRGPQCY